MPSVSSGAVRDFRGAMAGRGDKGLLITTGTFTSSAREEATRDGAPPIDLEVPPVGSADSRRPCTILAALFVVDARSSAPSSFALPARHLDVAHFTTAPTGGNL